ncbi:MAG: ExbD/TolR family protein [Terriglobales bacterium]
MAFTTPEGRTRTALADINVTPLVDVMLVLLVIFMITAPVIQSGIQVSVPFTHNTRILHQDRLVVTVDRAQNVYINDQLVNIHALAAELKAKLPKGAAGRMIYVRADRHVAWGALAQVMDAIKEGGLKQVSLVTQPYTR